MKNKKCNWSGSFLTHVMCFTVISSSISLCSCSIGTDENSGQLDSTNSDLNSFSNKGDDQPTSASQNIFFARQLPTSGDEVVYQSPWTWTCTENSVCERGMANNTTGPKVPLNICWLTCGKYGPLWPYPTVKTLLGSQTVVFYPQNAEVVGIHAPHKAVKAMLGYAGNVLLDYLFRMHPNSEGQSAFPMSSNGRGIENNILTITLTAQSGDTKISLDTDESYTLKITSVVQGSGIHVKVEIDAETYFGARHGLETLGQLIAFDEENECLQVVSSVTIEDRPAFKFRGLMIDTARNFIPISSLKKVVDAMSYNKMNMLHWHLTDSNSFPFYSKRIPYMTTYGAYSEAQIYSPKDVKDLVLYSRLRGVKIIPELDSPAHAGNGWQWGNLMGLGDLALCINSEPWRSYCGQPPCGQLNPLNNYTYLVLGELYKDFLEVFDQDYFHMGNDEVFFQCWYSRPEIREWLKNRGTHDLMELWGHFQERAFEKLIEANGGKYITPIVWTSDMTNRARQFLSPEDYIIQVWTGATQYEVRELLENKYRIIFSNLDAAYLDHGYGTWLGRDHFWTIKTWQNLYDNDLIKIAEYHLGANSTYYAITSGQILGGEATLWSEKVDQHNMEMKLWPRSAAFAERLWSSPQNRTNEVYARLLHQRARLVRRGIHADRLQPESCHLIAGNCNDPYSRL